MPRKAARVTSFRPSSGPGRSRSTPSASPHSPKLIRHPTFAFYARVRECEIEVRLVDDTFVGIIPASLMEECAQSCGGAKDHLTRLDPPCRVSDDDALLLHQKAAWLLKYRRDLQKASESRGEERAPPVASSALPSWKRGLPGVLFLALHECDYQKKQLQEELDVRQDEDETDGGDRLTHVEARLAFLAKLAVDTPWRDAWRLLENASGDRYQDPKALQGDSERNSRAEKAAKAILGVCLNWLDSEEANGNSPSLSLAAVKREVESVQKHARAIRKALKRSTLLRDITFADMLDARTHGTLLTLLDGVQQEFPGYESRSVEGPLLGPAFNVVFERPVAELIGNLETAASERLRAVATNRGHGDSADLYTLARDLSDAMRAPLDKPAHGVVAALCSLMLERDIDEGTVVKLCNRARRTECR